MMYTALTELQKQHPSEDEILIQYLVPAICKAAAVLGMVSSRRLQLRPVMWDLLLLYSHVNLSSGTGLIGWSLGRTDWPTLSSSVSDLIWLPLMGDNPLRTYAHYDSPYCIMMGQLHVVLKMLQNSLHFYHEIVLYVWNKSSILNKNYRLLAYHLLYKKFTSCSFKFVWEKNFKLPTYIVKLALNCEIFPV